MNQTVDRCIASIFAVFGVVEVTLNTVYLVRVDGLALARLSHSEIPVYASEPEILFKVIAFWLFGALALGIAIYFWSTGVLPRSFITSGLITIFIYSVCETLFYKSIMSGVYTVLYVAVLGGVSVLLFRGGSK